MPDCFRIFCHPALWQVTADIKKPAATVLIPRALISDFVHTEKRVPDDHHLSNRNGGESPPHRGFLHHRLQCCRLAANSAPHNVR